MLLIEGFLINISIFLHKLTSRFLQKTDLGMLVFVADNLAHFPYHTLDEPLFLMSQIEVYVSVSGSNVLQSFKEVSVRT